MQCERMVPHSNYGRKWKSRCEKEAVNTDGLGRNLCVSCSRKHNKKLQKGIDNQKQYISSLNSDVCNK